jgi:hypothetical protein
MATEIAKPRLYLHRAAATATVVEVAAVPCRKLDRQQCWMLLSSLGKEDRSDCG